MQRPLSGRYFIPVAIAFMGLGSIAKETQAAVVYSGSVNIPIPATGVSLDVVTGAYGTSLANPSLSAFGTTFLALQDPGTIPADNTNGACGTGSYMGTGSTFYNLVEGETIWPACSGDDGSSNYSDLSVTAQIDASRTWNLNSSENLIGFRFVDEKDGLLHYGWARISLGSDATSSQPRAIVEYAYDDGPGAWIDAGAKATVTWDFDPTTGLPAHVQPMQHALNGFMPLMTQSLPLPINDDATTQRNSCVNNVCVLRKEIDTLWARGIVPHVFIGQVGGATDGGALSTALTLQEAGEPIYLFSDLTEYDFWPSNTTPSLWFTAPDGAVVPVYPLATPTAGYNALLPEYQFLKSQGINSVAGLWMDYEQYPYWWAASAEQGASYAAPYYTDTYAAGSGVPISQYGSNLIGSTNPKDPAMIQYAVDLGDVLLRNSAYKALTDVFGTGPMFANFGSYYSSATTPYGGLPPYGANLPPTTYAPQPGIVANPSAYADSTQLSGYFLDYAAANYPVNQTTVDTAYWWSLLTGISSSAANNGTAGRTMAFVSYYVPDYKGQPWGDYGMSVPLYKEMLRHFWLRGVSGMAVFNPQSPYRSTAQSYNELEYARSVLDEMLSFRSFLVNGVPMNYTVNSGLFSNAVEWSGMSNSATNPTQWVVRTVSRTGSDSVVPFITPQSGLTFSNIPAPTGGATFILNSDGTMHRVDSRPASLYLQFENGYQDSSGNNLTAVPGSFPSSVPAPAVSANVPVTGAGVTSILNGAYGLYAHQNNQYSMALNGPSAGNSDAGNYVQVANTGNIFNVASFTVEAFVNIDPTSPDAASILSKGLSSASGAYDWELLYLSSGQLMVRLGISNMTPYFLESTNALTPGWHHVAFTYDASSGVASPTVSLYVDHVQWAWTASSNQSLSGVLPGPMLRNTGDDFIIGSFNEGIIASVDEVRFTPEVLDPMQMLTNAALQ